MARCCRSIFKFCLVLSLSVSLIRLRNSHQFFLSTSRYYTTCHLPPQQTVGTTSYTTHYPPTHASFRITSTPSKSHTTSQTHTQTKTSGHLTACRSILLARMRRLERPALGNTNTLTCATCHTEPRIHFICFACLRISQPQGRTQRERKRVRAAQRAGLVKDRRR